MLGKAPDESINVNLKFSFDKNDSIVKDLFMWILLLIRFHSIAKQSDER